MIMIIKGDAPSTRRGGRFRAKGAGWRCCKTGGARLPGRTPVTWQRESGAPAGGEESACVRASAAGRCACERRRNKLLPRALAPQYSAGGLASGVNTITCVCRGGARELTGSAWRGRGPQAARASERAKLRARPRVPPGDVSRPARPAPQSCRLLARAAKRAGDAAAPLGVAAPPTVLRHFFARRGVAPPRYCAPRRLAPSGLR